MATPADRSTLLRFTKHHGAGNDFLVPIDPASAWSAARGPGPGRCATGGSGWAPTG